MPFLWPRAPLQQSCLYPCYLTGQPLPSEVLHTPYDSYLRKAGLARQNESVSDTDSTHTQDQRTSKRMPTAALLSTRSINGRNGPKPSGTVIPRALHSNSVLSASTSRTQLQTGRWLSCDLGCCKHETGTQFQTSHEELSTSLNDYMHTHKHTVAYM